MSERAIHDDTALARRAARISAAQAVVKADKRLGLETHPSIENLAKAPLVPADDSEPHRRVAS
ncbi:MAG: hypothetical protein WD794_05955 [Mycobacteriales bacterium]